MKLKDKLNLVLFCVDYYESGLNLELSDNSVSNIHSLVMEDDELNEMEEFEEDFFMNYVQLSDIELAECVSEEIDYFMKLK